MSADVEFGVDFNDKTLAGLMRRKREWRAGGEKRLNPPERNVNVQMAHVWVWLKVEGNLSSFREHPSDAELGVFYHFPWQLAPKAQV